MFWLINVRIKILIGKNLGYDRNDEILNGEKIWIIWRCVMMSYLTMCNDELFDDVYW